MPEPPIRPPVSPPSSRGSWLSIVLAALLAVFAAVVLFILTLGQVLPVLVIGGAIFLLAGVHYFLWGWWLGKMIQHEDAEEDADA